MYSVFVPATEAAGGPVAYPSPPPAPPSGGCPVENRIDDVLALAANLVLAWSRDNGVTGSVGLTAESGGRRVRVASLAVEPEGLSPELADLLEVLQDVPPGSRWKACTIKRRLEQLGRPQSMHSVKHGLASLVRKGLVRSWRGTGGGYAPAWDRVEVA